MKRMLLPILVLLITAACSARVHGEQMNSSLSSDHMTEDNQQSVITIETPMTVSETLIPGTNQTLKIKLVEGSYFEDDHPGAYMGANYEGAFEFEISDDQGEVLGRTKVNDFYQQESLTFVDSFELVFHDYNEDGYWDFTLGQPMNSNGKLYKLFTIGPDYTIRELPVKDHPELYISGGEGSRYSVKLEMEGEEFVYQSYDQLTGEYVHKALKWQDDAFVEVSRDIRDIEDTQDTQDTQDTRDSQETQVILNDLPETVTELKMSLSGKLEGELLPYFFYQIEDGHHYLAEGRIDVEDNGDFAADIRLKSPTNGFGSIVFYGDADHDGQFDVEKDTDRKLGNSFFQFEESLIVPLSGLETE
ncbi:hypothetical protein [Paenibacillus sp. J2TS4]|uniref:hypothetical protein n=1 Tax=Paenibacillus sp. J2TS4 TaxID=2807194 RepID=UPI001B2EFE63|nr:hypothetical protein [Paenibacillus sp. J2TS4]GIP33190.1 hypothetical protein J2TS4_24000 [Paenibacillus sp. J2TS4]